MEKIIQSLERAFAILELLSQYPNGLGLLEISKETNLHKATTHRILKSLILLGYAEQMENTKYTLTYKLYEIGNSKIKNLDLRKISKKFLEELSHDINEVVHLVIRQDIDVIYIEKIEAQNSITMNSFIGMRRPLIQTAVGKALLSEMNDSDIESIYRRSKIQYPTANFLTLEQLMEQIQETRKTKIAFDLEENEDGVSCIATVIYSGQKPIGAISISGPAYRIEEKKCEVLYQKLLQTSLTISHQLHFI